MPAKDSLASNKITVSTQQFLDIAEIKDDVVIMRDGSMRMVLIISSINFALKSEEEQNAIISAYVGFLNNLSFPIQVVIQSRELNIDNYLSALRQKEKEQTNELLKLQTGDYINYITELISISRIMNKRFFAVIPYNPATDKQKGFFSRSMDIFRPQTLIKMKEEKFRQRKEQLMRRVESALSGLQSMGLESRIVDTQGLIELYYDAYNPLESANEKMTDTNQLRVSE